MIAANGIVNGVYSDSSYTTPATLPEAVSYTVTYADGTEIQDKHLLAKKNGNTPTTETYKVRIEYRNDDEIDPDDLDNDNDHTYYFKFSVNYVQADSTAIDKNASASAIHYVSRQNEGQITPGDIIGIGETEDFYVISSNQEKTVLLAKYNLMVGNMNDGSDNQVQIPTNTPGYGLQSVNALGYNLSNNIATVVFSDINYWMSDNILIDVYNKNNTIYYDSSNYMFKYISNDEQAYPYIYDSNSNVYQYISGENGYVEKLKDMGAPSTIVGRLLSYEEADAVKNVQFEGISIIFDGHQDYLLGSASSSDCLWMVTFDGSDFYYDGCYYYHGDSVGTGGVRPVIEIPTSEIK